MAIIANQNLAHMRRGYNKRVDDPQCPKATINAALQAIEDTIENSRNAINTAINAATAPFVFSPAQKRILIALWAANKFNREGV